MSGLMRIKEFSERWKNKSKQIEFMKKQKLKKQLRNFLILKKKDQFQLLQSQMKNLKKLKYTINLELLNPFQRKNL